MKKIIKSLLHSAIGKVIIKELLDEVFAKLTTKVDSTILVVVRKALDDALNS